LSFATLCFAFALAATIHYAQDFTGFYYHPRILALTHLATLGWITGNILGSLYLVGPMALQVYLPASRLDLALFWIYAVGVTGMAAHFWIDRPEGMAYSAGCVYLVLLWMSIRMIAAFRLSKAPSFVLLHLRFSFANILVAGGWGLLLAIHKVHGFLPTSTTPNVLAHAHLAAAGWAMMMVFGVAYRLLPMFLPGEPAKGSLPWISALLLEIGVLGLFAAHLLNGDFVLVFGILTTAGILLFMANAVRTALRRKPAPPPEPPKPDFSLLHVLFSFVCLVFSVITGLVLTRMEPTQESLQLSLAYGFVALIGFLGQMVIGMKPKILSILAWYYAFKEVGSSEAIPRPVDMPIRTLQIFTFILWLIGVPLVATGILLQSRLVIVAGALMLMAALVISTAHEVHILRLIFKTRRGRQ
jgi:hypothetical protein